MFPLPNSRCLRFGGAGIFFTVNSEAPESSIEDTRADAMPPDLNRLLRLGFSELGQASPGDQIEPRNPRQH